LIHGWSGHHRCSGFYKPSIYFIFAPLFRAWVTNILFTSLKRLIEEIQKKFDEQCELTEKNRREEAKQKIEYLKEMIFSACEAK